MSLEVGIVGLPYAGKTTIFSALAHTSAETTSSAHVADRPNVGMASIVDDRLERVAEIAGSRKVTHAALRIIDVGGTTIAMLGDGPLGKVDDRVHARDPCEIPSIHPRTRIAYPPGPGMPACHHRRMDTPGVVVGADGVARCWWGSEDDLYREYHDGEWGHPVADDRRLFEKLNLEGFQAGLSWLTILRKRESFRKAFEDFDIQAVARFGPRRVDRLLADPGIVRNRAKIQATVNNARRCLELLDEFDSLAGYVWRFEPEARSRPTVLDHATLLQIADSAESKAMSRDLRRRGWSFVGPTTAYAFMEAMGLVNDHLDRCDVRAGVERERHQFQRPPAAR